MEWHQTSKYSHPRSVKSNVLDTTWRERVSSETKTKPQNFWNNPLSRFFFFSPLSLHFVTHHQPTRRDLYRRTFSNPPRSNKFVFIPLSLFSFHTISQFSLSFLERKGWEWWGMKKVRRKKKLVPVPVEGTIARRTRRRRKGLFREFGTRFSGRTATTLRRGLCILQKRKTWLWLDWATDLALGGEPLAN